MKPHRYDLLNDASLFALIAENDRIERKIRRTWVVADIVVCVVLVIAVCAWFA